MPPTSEPPAMVPENAQADTEELVVVELTMPPTLLSGALMLPSNEHALIELYETAVPTMPPTSSVASTVEL